MKNACPEFDQWMQQGELERLEAHAVTCAECREELRAWNEISTVAKSLQETWESPTLWPAIEESLRADRNVVAFRRTLNVWAVAAAIALMAGFGAIVWRVTSTKDRPALQELAVVEDAVQQVESTEEAHRRSIAELEKVAEPALEASETPLIVSYREKLMLLDDAIAEIEASIAINRRNPYLRKQLLTLYDEKGQTLQQVVRETSNVQ